MSRSTWGSINKVDNDTYDIRWSKGYDKNGKRLRGYKRVKGTRKQAEQKLAEIRVRYEGNVDLTRAITVHDFWDTYYLPSCKHLAKSTIRGYKNHYKVSIRPHFGNQDITTITHHQVQEWLSSMTYGKARSARTLLRAMLNKAQELEIVDRHVLNDRYTLPDKSNKSNVQVNDEIYTLDEMNQVFNAIRDEIFEPAYITSAFGGLRRAESFGLKLDDITSDGGYVVLNIKRGVQRVGTETVVVPLKTKDSERVVTIPTPYSTRLLEIRDEYIDRGYIWLMDDGFGEPLNPDSVASAYKRWFATQPYKFVPFKNLRNSYATALHEQGADLGMVAKMLGHTTPTVTYKHYDKPSIDAKKDIASKLGSKNYPELPNSNIIEGIWGNDNKQNHS